VYTARGGISAIISLTDIIRYISSHASELAGLVSRTLLELGLLCKPLRTVPSTMPTDEVLRSLTDEPIVGVVDENTHLVASFSQSDLRGVGTSAFGCLALPVGEYLVQRLGVIAPATAEGDAWAAALREAKTAICLAPDASLADAMCAVVDKRMHHVFVEGRPRENVYVVSLADLLDSGAMSGTPDGLRMAYGMHPGLRSSKSVI
jgi:CBS domain-containing protein